MRKQSQLGRITTAEAVLMLLEEMGEVHPMLWENLRLRIKTYKIQHGRKGLDNIDERDT